MFFSFDFAPPQYLRVLPETFERLDASRWFLILSSEHQEESLYAKRLIRASLNEFKSSFDCLNTDLRNIGKKELWDRSKYCEEMKRDFILRIVRNARDLSFHTSKLKPKFESSSIRVISEDESYLSSIAAFYFDNLDAEYDRTTLSRFNEDEIEKMQEIFESFPCFMLLSEAYKRFSVLLESFLLENQLVTPEESQAFWDR